MKNLLAIIGLLVLFALTACGTEEVEITHEIESQWLAKQFVEQFVH